MKLLISNKKKLIEAQARFLAMSAKEKLRELANDESGMGTVEIILIIVEKRVTGNTYVLCGN